MALVPDQKFSTFQNGGDVTPGDTVVGLRGGINTRFLYTGELPPGYIVPIDQGGTGSDTAAGARANLGLGTMAVQNANNVAITGGTAALDSGQVAAAPVNPTDLVNKQYVDSISTGVQNVVGTANQINVDSTDPENPILSLSATLNLPGIFTVQSTTAIDSIINDNTMATASATNLSTALSIKAYVDSLDSGNVKSVSGTANRITSTGGQNPVIDIAATYIGQSSITTLGTIATGIWQATLVGIPYGGTGVSAVTTSPTATAFAGWDSNLNMSANNFLQGTSLITTSGATTTLTVASAQQQIFSGTNFQNVTMPAVGTLVNGQSYRLINDSSNALFVSSSGANSIVTMQPLTQAVLTFNGVAGTAAASWDLQYTSNTIGVQSITGTANQVIASSPTGNITLSLPQNIATTSSPTFNNLTLGGGLVKDTNGNNVWGMVASPSAVNYLQTVNSGTGTAVQLAAAGTDTNIQITILPKGIGSFVAGSQATVNQQIFFSGTGYQHQTIFSYPSTAATRAVAWQDAGGTVAYLADILSNGTVNPGTINQLAYYGATGNAVSGLPLNPNSVLVSDGASFPSLSTTLPNGLAMGTPASLTLINATGLPVGGISATGTPSSTTYLRGDGSWQTLAPGGVVSGQGTTNQVLVNGTSGSAQTGALVFTLPQSIATSSAVQFASLRLSNTGILDANNNPIIGLSATASAVNYFTFTNAATTGVPALDFTGSDTNVNGIYRCKGTGVHIMVSASTTPLQMRSGTSSQHWTNFTFANTAATRNVTWQDADGTVAYVAQLPSVASTTLTNGQLWIGSTGNPAVAATLTAGAGISIANAAGSITISGTGSGIGWTEVTGTSQTMIPDSGWITNNGSLVTLTLPTTAALGTAISIVGKGVGGWRIAQNSGQTIIIGNISSTTGTGGSVTSQAGTDSVNLICTTANTVWTTTGAPQSAGLTIV